MEGRFSTAELAAILGTDEWRVRRLFEAKVIDEPERFAGKRAICSSQIPAIVDALRARGWLVNNPTRHGAAVLEWFDSCFRLLTTENFVELKPIPKAVEDEFPLLDDQGIALQLARPSSFVLRCGRDLGHAQKRLIRITDGLMAEADTAQRQAWRQLKEEWS